MDSSSEFDSIPRGLVFNYDDVAIVALPEGSAIVHEGEAVGLVLQNMN